jgi:hypothetical protein
MHDFCTMKWYNEAGNRHSIAVRFCQIQHFTAIPSYPLYPTWG